MHQSPTQQTPTVSFARHIRVRKHIHRSSISEEEMGSTWYTRRELSEAKKILLQKEKFKRFLNRGDTDDEASDAGKQKTEEKPKEPQQRLNTLDKLLSVALRTLDQKTPNSSSEKSITSTASPQSVMAPLPPGSPHSVYSARSISSSRSIASVTALDASLHNYEKKQEENKQHRLPSLQRSSSMRSKESTTKKKGRSTSWMPAEPSSAKLDKRKLLVRSNSMPIPPSMTPNQDQENASSTMNQQGLLDQHRSFRIKRRGNKSEKLSEFLARSKESPRIKVDRKRPSSLQRSSSMSSTDRKKKGRRTSWIPVPSTTSTSSNMASQEPSSKLDRRSLLTRSNSMPTPVAVSPLQNQRAPSFRVKRRGNKSDFLKMRTEELPMMTERKASSSSSWEMKQSKPSSSRSLPSMLESKSSPSSDRRLQMKEGLKSSSSRSLSMTELHSSSKSSRRSMMLKGRKSSSSRSLSMTEPHSSSSQRRLVMKGQRKAASSRSLSMMEPHRKPSSSRRLLTKERKSSSSRSLVKQASSVVSNDDPPLDYAL